MPDAQENDWILPRTDNDYIYFRDYNKGGSNKYGEHDKGAFGHYEHYDTSNEARRYWLETWFDKNEQGVGQEQEIFYDQKYHHYWYAAKFKKANGETVVELF